jgi:outer membrane protein OmpA-like peptidoglycan-associated protein
MKKLLLLTFCFAITLVVKAQTIDKQWNIGLHGGITQYKGDLGNDFYRTDMSLYGMGGVSVSRYITSHFDVNLFATKGMVGYSRPSGRFSRNITTTTLNLRFNIIGDRSFVKPYLILGGGFALFDKDLTVTENNVDFITPSFGGGVNLKLGPSVMLNLQETFFYTTGDKRDGVTGKENDMYLFHSIGFSFNFGNKKDADRDGVSDYRDKCPSTPAGVSVDKLGCPLDRDNDGVADYLDQCPEFAGTEALNGCPDADGDGIADKDDDCPDTKGLKALKGCPDTDGDGIADKDDRCPDVAGPAALKGCPDTDKDGVADIDDKCANTKAGYVVDEFGCPLDNDKDGIVNEEDDCPDKAGNMALKGCPDTDGDGVSDKYDRCPTVKGTIENKGCPEMAIADVKKITNIASRIFFETNSDKLKVASLSQLDELAVILKKYEAANLFIEGHADSQGEDDFNLTLSQKRTEAVKQYLMEKGILEQRLSAKGFGETQPIADNKTEAGRAKNRRVVLKTSY